MRRYCSTWYHLTDHQFSTVALIDNTAELVERITYDAYGEPRHHWPGDLTGDGEVNAADQTAMAAAYKKILGEANYNVDADITRTGTVDHIDTQWTATQNFKAAMPKGVLSSPAAGNTIGYAGYVFNGETLIYTVRFRHYDPGPGRWLERDPLGYVDGMSLYGYVGSNPLVAVDPYGEFGFKGAAIGGLIGGIIGGGAAWLAGEDWGGIAKGAAVGALAGAAIGSGAALVGRVGIKAHLDRAGTHAFRWLGGTKPAHFQINVWVKGSRLIPWHKLALRVPVPKWLYDLLKKYGFVFPLLFADSAFGINGIGGENCGKAPSDGRRRMPGSDIGQCLVVAPWSDIMEALLQYLGVLGGPDGGPSGGGDGGAGSGSGSGTGGTGSNCSSNF